MESVNAVPHRADLYVRLTPVGSALLYRLIEVLDVSQRYVIDMALRHYAPSVLNSSGAVSPGSAPPPPKTRRRRKGPPGPPRTSARALHVQLSPAGAALLAAMMERLGASVSSVVEMALRDYANSVLNSSGAVSPGSAPPPPVAPRRHKAPQGQGGAAGR